MLHSRCLRGLLTAAFVVLLATAAAAGVLEGKIVIPPPDGAFGHAPAAVAPGAIVAPDSMEGHNHIVSSSVGPDIFSGININQFLGADRFYNAGYTGGNSVLANVEAGHIWSGHETLGHLAQTIHETGPNAGTQTGEVDRHATWVGMHLGGRLGGSVQGEHQRGMAYGAQLWSGAIATNWTGSAYSLSFSFNGDTYLTPYVTAFQTGVNSRTADVVNSSWGFEEPTGYNFWTISTDALANANPQTTFVASAGNDGDAPNTVGGPAAGANVIAVGALGRDYDAPPYETIASFSSRGPNDYYDPINGLVEDTRAPVDIAAPGMNLTSAYYGGATGGNSTTLGGTPFPGANLYSGNLGGTSFAAPIVAGGAALLTDAGYGAFPANPNARDSRVIKAVLLNSADKIPGWDNGQFESGGIIYTFQSLDYASGTGRMNLDRAFDQYLGGTADVPGFGGGTVEPVGWDLGMCGADNSAIYFINDVLLGGTTFNASLTWFRDRSLDVANQIAYDDSFDDLDLAIWYQTGGSWSVLARSWSTFNNVEHLSIVLPETTRYAISVDWFQEIFDTGSDANQEVFGLAWYGTAAPSVIIPEPATLGLVAIGILCIRRRRRAA